jgi:hypothetical protein
MTTRLIRSSVNSLRRVRMRASRWQRVLWLASDSSLPSLYEGNKGVRVWGFGKTVYEQLLNLVLNPEYGDITDPEMGTDIQLNYGKPAGAAFPQTKLMPSRRTTAICPDISSEQCAELLESVPDFGTLFERKSSEDVQRMLDEYLADDESAEELSSETTQYGGGAPAPQAGPSSSVEQAFNDLLA